MLIEIEINDKDLLPTPEQAIILSNFKYEKGKMEVAIQAPGFLVTQATKESPLKLYFGSSHNEITKKRTADAKALKRAQMEQRNKMAQIAKNNKEINTLNKDKK
jgi:hypothetical protein